MPTAQELIALAGGTRTVLNLLFNKSGRIGNLRLDCILNESYRLENRLTTYPIEDGATINDHVIEEPDQLSITGFVTDSPVNPWGIIDNVVTTVTSLGKESRRTTAFELLEEFMKGTLNESNVRVKTPLTVVTGLKTYENMIVVSLSVPRDARTGDTLRFDAIFKKVNIVKTSITQKPKTENLGAEATDKGEDRLNKGKVTGTTAGTGAANRVSILKSGTNWIIEQTQGLF